MNDYNFPENYSTEPALSVKGRFGRLSYLGWHFLLSFTAIIVGFLVLLILSVFSNNNTHLFENIGMGFGLLLLVAYLVFLYFIVIIGIRRLHDLNRTGWLCLLLIVPLVNIIFGLYMLFARGTDGANDYGLPHETQPWEKFCAWLSILLIPALGVLAAISIPAYQDYVKKQQQTQIQMNMAVQELKATENELKQLEQQMRSTEQDSMASSPVSPTY